MKNPLSKARGLPAQAGFTLIELLVVIAIIAILSGIIITSLTGSKAKSRDAKRVSDVAQIQLSIEQYFDRCQKYPDSLSTTADFGCRDFSGNPIFLAAYISQIPTNPTGGSYDYAINSGGTDYILHTQLETNTDALSSSLKSGSSASTPGWYTTGNCYTGSKNGAGTYDYCIGSR